MNFEYAELILTAFNRGQQLNPYGQKGWELVQIINDNVAILKRRISENKSKELLNEEINDKLNKDYYHD